MASGNLGDLFVSLGIKDEMSETLRKIVKGMKGVDQATLDAKKQGEDLIRSLNGLNGNNFSKVFRDATKYIEENSKGLSNIVSLLKKVEDKADQNAISGKFLGAKDLPKIAEYLTAINAEFAKMAKDEARADSIKAWQSRISNALEYIGILQNIDLWQNKIDRTKANNPNVNSKTLDNAKKSLSEIRSQIVGLLSSGGIDTSGTLSNFGKFLSIARKNVNEIISKFKEDNPLSAFSGGAAKVEADISRVTEKLAKLRDLMSEGTTKGYNTSMLGGNITELGNLLARLQSAQGNKNILTDEAQMKNLLSDVAVGMVKATSATQAYGREKGKVIAQEREHNRVINESNSIQSGDNKRIKALTEIGILLRDIQNLEGKSAGLGVNSTTLQTIRSEVESIKGVLGGLSGRDLMGQQLKNALDKLSEIKIRAHEAMKEIGVENKSSETRKRLKDETESIVSNLSRQRRAFEENAEIRRKFSREITSIYEFTSGALNSKAFNPSDYLSQKIAEKKRELDNYINSADRVKKEIVNLGNEIKDLQNKIHGLSPTFDGKDAFGALLSGDKLTKYNDLLDRLKSTVNSHDLLKESLDSEKLYSANVKSFEREIDQLSKLKDRAKEFDGRNAIELKNEIIQKNKELLQSEKQYSKELSASEKQRQSELEISRRRIQSMEKALSNLQEKRFTSKMLGLDTSEAETKIFNLKIQLSQLWELENKLFAKDMTAVGKLGNIGNGREVQAANDLARSYDRANKEAQKGVEIEQKRQAEIAKSAAKARNDLAAAFAGANAEAKKMQSVVGDIKSLFLQGGIVFGAQQFFNSIVQTGGEIVQQHVALRSILGDVAKADELFAQTQQLALQSPFKFGELNRDVKQLAAFGVEANDLYDTTKRLADIASGLGVSFERLGLAYGQVKARSWLDGKELRQFAYAGLPLLQRITEMYNREGKNGKTNYTEADVKKMISNRGVSFNDVQKVLWEMTDEGGQFYNMQLVLSETLLGRWNKLIDAWDIMLGKFAEGKSVIGGTFSFLINRATDLVLTLDKLSPAVLSFGAMFAARKLSGFASSKLSVGSLKADYSSQLGTQLRSYAIEQQKLVTEGRITQEVAAQNVQKRAYLLADESSLKASFSRMALEGKMSVLQMQRALKEGLIGKELVQELATMGMITARQEQIILNGGRTAAVFNMAGSKLSGLFNMLGGWWGIAITTISSLVMGFSQYSNKIEQETKTLTDSARQNAKRIDEFLASAGSKPTDREGLKKDIDGMKDLLKQSNLYTDTIKEQVERSGDLSKQYDILKEKIVEARKATKFDEQFSSTAAGAVARSGQGMLNALGSMNESQLGKGWYADFQGWFSGLFNEDLETNANDLTESLNKVSLALSTAFDESQRKKIEDVANSMLPVGDRTKTLEEKIAMLRDKGGNDWDDFVNRVASGDKDLEKHLENVGDASKGMMSDLNEIAEDDVPKMIAYLQQSLHLYGKDFEDWCKRNPHKYAQMWDDMLAVAKVKAPAIADIIKRLAMSAVGIVTTDDRKGENGRNGYNSGIDTDFANVIRNRLFKNGTVTGKKKKGRFWVAELDSALRQVQDDSWETTGENVRKKLKEARNELDMMNTGKADKRSAAYLNASHSYNLWKAIADAGNISDDLGKNKVTGNFGKNNRNGRQEDTLLKELQERLSSLKSARQMYQKYKPYMSDDEAKRKTYKLFPNVVGLDLDNYADAVDALIKNSKFKATTPERRKFLTSTNREKAEWRWDEVDKPAIEVQASERNAYMNRLSSQWDLYKTLLEKTGNKRYAESAWIDAFQMDDKSKSLMDLYYQNYGKHFNMQEALNMSDEEAKKTFKDPDEYNEWKKIVDLLRNNYVQSLQDGADAMQKMASYADKIRAINLAYDEKLKNQNDPVVIARLKRMRNQELGTVEEEEFKNSSDYVNFYGAIMSLGFDKAQKIGENIRKYLNDALSSGKIEAREYAKEIKLLDEQLSKLTSPRKTFLNGGLKGLADQKIQDANEQYTLAQSKITEGKKIKDIGNELGDENLIARGNSMIESGKAMAKAASILFKDGTKAKESLDKFAGVVNVIDQNVQGMFEAFNDVKETATLLGVDTESDGWQDASAFFESFSGMSSSVSKIVNSAENGNIGGILSGAVGIFTSPIKAFAKSHDAKLDRQIKLSERQLTELKNLSSNISSVIEKTLGGVYSYQRSESTASKLSEIKKDYRAYDALAKTSLGKNFLGGKNLSHYSQDTYESVLKSDSNYSAYADQLALLNAQKDELVKQRNAEEDKKKKDKDKIADYNQQITEMELSIKTFAQDFLKDIYSIDMKSWASELTDAVVGAWEKGEDAVDAYREKVKDMVKDVTKNIIAQKIMENALSKPLDYLTGILEEKGQLDETDMDTLAGMLYDVGDKTIPQITGIFEALKNRGWDLRDNSGSASTTNSIKSITEETADLLASYLNQIRLDVSVNRENIKLIADAVTGLPELNVIAKSQLTAMNQLVSLAQYRNSKLDDMYSWMRSVTSGTGTKSISMK